MRVHDVRRELPEASIQTHWMANVGKLLSQAFDFQTGVAESRDAIVVPAEVRDTDFVHALPEIRRDVVDDLRDAAGAELPA
ncbi:hypothetical protein GCM10028856_27610 [Halopiger thermotolerans]